MIHCHLEKTTGMTKTNGEGYKMFKALFNIIINMLASIIQIVVWPVNSIITATLPDLSDKILQVTNTLNTMFDSITWALGVIPTPITSTLLFIITVEVAKHTIFMSTHTLIKIWNLFQKVKFW